MTDIKIGRYEIRDELGEGGMGTVYRAYDPTLGREIALKVLHPHLFSSDPDFSLRFEQEARTIAALEHSHIVPLYEFGEDSNGLFIAMRLMKGGSLRDKLAHGPLSLAETTAILERVGSALDKAHLSGIIHRDLKPGNILFDGDGSAFLGDFGIVKTEDADRLKTRTGQALGTPHYMSPEQLDVKELDGRSDIYALGVIFYEMVTGDRPYDHPTSTVRVMVMHLNAPIPSLLDAIPDLPPSLDTVLQTAMAKEPANRYDTAQEMVLAIKTIPASPAPTATTPAVESIMEPPILEIKISPSTQEEYAQAPESMVSQTDEKQDKLIVPRKVLLPAQPKPIISQSAESKPQQATTPKNLKVASPAQTSRKENSFLSRIVKPARTPQETSYWKAIGWHLLFGLGLFYVDSRLKRRWVYFICAIYAVFDLSLRLDFATFIISLGVWLLSFIDVLLACRNQRLKLG